MARHLLARGLLEQVPQPGGSVEHRVLGVHMEVGEGIAHGVVSVTDRTLVVGPGIPVVHNEVHRTCPQTVDELHLCDSTLARWSPPRP